MSFSPEDGFNPDLIDLHLGRLAAPQRAALEQQIADDPRLAADHATLTRAFDGLRGWDTPSPRADLQKRINARIAAAGRPPRVIRPRDEWTLAAENDAPVLIRLGSLREIIAAAAIIMLAVSVAVPSLLNMRERTQRMACSNNLRAIGQGVQQYASTFGASLPFVGWGNRNSWRPTEDPYTVVLPNRRHVYPLLRYAYVIDPGVFVCPAGDEVPMPRDQIAGRQDFVESRNLSYAYYNMSGVRPSVEDFPNLPVLADDNPLFDDGVPLFDRLTFRRPHERNSRAHGGAGQNVLMADGHFKWTTTPNSGINGDNIWMLQDVREYTGREGPASATDAHLLR